MSGAANLEVKFRDVDLAAVAARLAELEIPVAATEHQVDIYYPAPHGRLKLRIVDGRHGTLIGYRRPDESGVRRCEYVLAPVAEPGRLADALSLALGERSRVVKERVIHLFCNVRIHLDRVERLGDFVEFEAVLGQPADHGAEPSAVRLEQLTEQLGLTACPRVDAGYADLLTR